MMNGTGWVSLADWESIVVPFILKECQPRANGKWHLTHAVEIEVPSAS
jgi:DMSO/TMAO reductase YedYZ molybdopterin-dependent catalytic subunit